MRRRVLLRRRDGVRQHYHIRLRMNYGPTCPACGCPMAFHGINKVDYKGKEGYILHCDESCGACWSTFTEKKEDLEKLFTGTKKRRTSLRQIAAARNAAQLKRKILSFEKPQKIEVPQELNKYKTWLEDHADLSDENLTEFMSYDFPNLSEQEIMDIIARFRGRRNRLKRWDLHFDDLPDETAREIISRKYADKPDEEGFIFITNQKKGESLPLDFAKSMGFQAPIFKFKKPFISPALKEEQKRDMEKNYEGVWVKDQRNK